MNTEPIPKLCGADMELGNSIAGAPMSALGTGYEASRALLQEIPGVSGGSTFTRYPANGVGQSPVNSGTTDPLSQDWGRQFHPNGGCQYIDLNHLEICIAEALDARDHLAGVQAGYRIAREASFAANRRLRADQTIHVFANNTDGLGNSFGSHLNFLVSRSGWNNIIHRLHYQLLLASYQASSIIYCGLGKVGSENGAPVVDYQISQRADFMEVLAGQQTTWNRPLINSRDESLCGRDPNLARLHVICYDHNLCDVAAFLKVGVLQIVLAMLECGWKNSALLLDDPVGSMQIWSHDPALQMPAPLLLGGEITAVDWQRRFFEEASAFVNGGRCDLAVPRAQEILTLWGDTLDKLAQRNFGALRSRLDWVLKRAILEQTRQEHRLPWNSPEMKHLDHLYSHLDPAFGLFWAYLQAGCVERLLREEEVVQRMQQPPENTRAWTRGRLLQLAHPSDIFSVDWDKICFRLSSPHRPVPRYFNLPLSNPLAFTRAQIEPLLPPHGKLGTALRMLGATEVVSPTATDNYSTVHTGKEIS